MGTKSNLKDRPAPSKIWHWNTFSVSEFEKNGLSVRVLSTDKTRSQLKEISSVIAAIEEGNSWIADKKMQVKDCVITSLPINEFRLYAGRPTLFLDYQKISANKAAHEIGHAIFDYFRTSKRDAALRIVDAFLKLKQTPLRNIPIRGPLNEKQTLTIPIGILVADPSSWSDTANREHPNDNANEYFASLREGLVRNKPGLKEAIKKIPDKDLQVLLNQVNEFVLELSTGRVTGNYFGSKSDAENALAKIKGPADFQEEIDDARDARLFQFACSPETFPGAELDVRSKLKIPLYKTPGIIDELPPPPNPFLPKPLHFLFSTKAEREREAAKVHSAVEAWEREAAKVHSAVEAWKRVMARRGQPVQHEEEESPDKLTAVRTSANANWFTSRPWSNRTSFPTFPTSRFTSAFPTHAFSAPYHPATAPYHSPYAWPAAYKPPPYAQAATTRPLGPIFDSTRLDPFRGPLNTLAGQRNWNSGPAVEHFPTGTRTWNPGGYAFSGFGGVTHMNLLSYRPDISRPFAGDPTHRTEWTPSIHDWNHP